MRQQLQAAEASSADVAAKLALPTAEPASPDDLTRERLHALGYD